MTGLGFNARTVTYEEGLPLELSVRVLEKQLLELRKSISMYIIGNNVDGVNVIIENNSVVFAPPATAVIIPFSQLQRERTATGALRCHGAHLLSGS